MNDRTLLIRLSAVVFVLGLHAVVLGGILTSKSVQPQIDMPESIDVRFVEIAPEITEAAPSAEPERAPEPEPEPQVDEPEPEPEIAPDPLPEPEPLVQREPEPEAIAPEPPKPAPKPEPKPKPKPKVKPRPKPVALPKPKISLTPAPTVAAAKAQVSAAPKTTVDPDRPRLIGKVDYLGRRPSPEYPRVSMRRGETGRVLVRVLISRQGTVAKASVRRSSGYTRLDTAALKAVATARFKPYTENGVPYPAIADIPFDFVL